MRIISLGGSEAVVEHSGVSRRIRVDLVPDVTVGDYVLLHAGFAIAKLHEQDALETLALAEEMGI